MEERSDTQADNHSRDNISDLSFLNEFEVCFMEDFFRKLSEIFEVTTFLSVRICDQAGNHDTSEQGQYQGNDLSQCEETDRTHTEH
ncbi:hypothetical protein D3C87_1864290 [compost metagenome]